MLELGSWHTLKHAVLALLYELTKLTDDCNNVSLFLRLIALFYLILKMKDKCLPSPRIGFWPLTETEAKLGY